MSETVLEFLVNIIKISKSDYPDHVKAELIEMEIRRKVEKVVFKQK